MTKRLISATFCAASGGILFEIFLGAFGSYLFGDSVKVFSLTTGAYMFFMGVGAFAIRPAIEDPLRRLLQVELGLVAFHLLLPFALWFCFTWGWGAGLLFWGGVAVSGTLVGTEIPLLLAVVRTEEGSSDGRVHQVLAADYVGALAASLLFGLLLLPHVGLIGSAAVAAALEGAAVLWLARRSGWMGAGATALGLALACLAGAGRLQSWLENRWVGQFYSAHVIHSEWTGHQNLTLVEFPESDCQCRRQALLLDRQFQWMTGPYLDEYHEMLVIPPVESFRRVTGRLPARVAVAGGGDGFDAERFRRLYGAPEVRVMELDGRVAELARTESFWREAGGKVFEDPAVRLVVGDAFTTLFEKTAGPYDVVVFDLPVPTSPALSRFYTPSFFARLGAAVSYDGHLLIQATSRGRTPFGRDKFICSLRQSLAKGGWRSEVIVGNQLDFYVVASRTALKWPGPGERLPGRHLTRGGELLALLTDPWNRFGDNCPALPDNSILRPVILEL